MWIWVMATQALINTRLGTAAGNAFVAAMISFAVGFTSLTIVLAVRTAGAVRWEGLRGAPWWAYVGGMLGAFFIVATIYGVPRVGAAVWLSAAVLGQVTFSLVADHFGFFGVSQHAVSLPRLVGIVLVIVGVVMVRVF
jgi:transporter family-2 protein